MLKLMSFRPNGDIEKKANERLPDGKIAVSIESAGFNDGKFYALVRVGDKNVGGASINIEREMHDWNDFEKKADKPYQTFGDN